MMLYADTGERVLEDAPHAISLSSNPLYKDACAVVVDIETVRQSASQPRGSQSVRHTAAQTVGLSRAVVEY